MNKGKGDVASNNLNLHSQTKRHRSMTVGRLRRDEATATVGRLLAAFAATPASADAMTKNFLDSTTAPLRHRGLIVDAANDDDRSRG